MLVGTVEQNYPLEIFLGKRLQYYYKILTDPSQLCTASTIGLYRQRTIRYWSGPASFTATGNVRLNRMDFIFEEFRIPLIIAALYFVFSAPIGINRLIMKVIPALFDSDGNITFVGSIGKSVSVRYILLSYLQNQ